MACHNFTNVVVLSMHLLTTRLSDSLLVSQLDIELFHFRLTLPSSPLEKFSCLRMLTGEF
jgi:hypothetical protein